MRNEALLGRNTPTVINGWASRAPICGVTKQPRGKDVTFEENVIFPPVAQQPNSDLCRLIVEVYRSHTHTHNQVGLLWTGYQLFARPTTHATQNKTLENMHVFNGIQTFNPKNQAATHLRPGLHSHRDRPKKRQYRTLNDSCISRTIHAGNTACIWDTVLVNTRMAEITWKACRKEDIR